MTESQIIDICTFFSDEIHNGGFLQFFYNDSNSYTRHITQCLVAIGADDIADICQTALSVFPMPLPDDSEQRRRFLTDNITPDIVRHLEICDARFYEQYDQFETSLGHFIDLHFPDDSISLDQTKSKDYVALLQKLEARTLSTMDDLTNAKLRRRSNKAGTEIHKLRMELYAKPDKGAPVILKLLQDHDPRVRIFAGAYCIQAQIHEDLGRSVLSQIAADTSLDKLLQIEAKDCIRYCMPFKTQ